jgi:ClpP class serine protease
VRRLLFAFLVSLMTIGSASADVRILSSSGGSVSGYLKFYSQLRQSGERVVIDGPCFSACTLVLSTVPRKRICVTSRAVLGFHAPQFR